MGVIQLLIWGTLTCQNIIRASITYDQKCINVTPSINYVSPCVPSSQTASCSKFQAAIIQPIILDLPKERLLTPALIALARFTSPFVGLPRRVGISLYLSDYAYCPCWSCCVHRLYFLFNWIEAVCLPQGYVCGDLASWCYDFYWSGKRALWMYWQHVQHQRGSCA